MTAVMILARKPGLLGRIPPSTITRKLIRRLGLPRHRPTENALTTLNHLGYGAAAGALYALLERLLPPRVPDIVKGALYGALVWAASYQVWVPALDLMPHPKHDRPGRPSSMLLAHLVYGGTLGSLA